MTRELPLLLLSGYSMIRLCLFLWPQFPDSLSPLGNPKGKVGGPGMRNHVHDTIMHQTTRAKRSPCEAARFELQILKEGYLYVELLAS